MVNAGASPVDYTTAVGKVRLLIGDTDASAVTGGIGTYAFYSDDELAALLTLYPDPRRAAVSALRTFAASPAIKLKVWGEGDLQVDGAKVSQVLINLADSIERGIVASDAGEGFTVSGVVGGEERPMSVEALLAYADRFPTGAFPGNGAFLGDGTHSRLPLATRLGVH